ncbi:MAG: threonylcarbamoyl-AMP synthase [Actinobacteria bacterium]|jgi:L-threonylcarbamoyladenylate synthase|uniref:L-threonylcarbamoyladenylate synthase n=1 Tax=freshwater metagenome TaxID=449393 RepID=A0A6J6EC86_9ZZZZ|nr:threonylcarbamoyl-AMP synthase [Actinomycetota bacterium]
MSIVVKMTTDAERRRGLVAAKAALMRGECVVMPTDTVYGVAANPFVPKGITSLLAAKRRDREMPIPVFVPNLDSALALSYQVSDQAKLIMEKFWPGAITLITKAHPTLKWDLGNADGTIALRIPLQRTALELLTETGPLGVTSANLTGEPAATDIESAQNKFGNSVSVYLDTGATSGEVASTIIDASQVQLRVVRVGVISISSIVEVTGATELIEGTHE